MGDTFLWHSSNTNLVELSLLWQSDYTLLCFSLTQASSPLQVKYADGELERLGIITVQVELSLCQQSCMGIFAQDIVACFLLISKQCIHIYTCHDFQNISFSLECFRKMLRTLSWLICFPNMGMSRICKFWEVHNKQAKVISCREVAFLMNRMISIASSVYCQLTLLFAAGCAFIKYQTKDQALAAIEALNGKHKIEVCQKWVWISNRFSYIFFYYWDLIAYRLVS